MTNTIYYAANRDDRLLEGTISTNYLTSSDLAYNQAYNDAADDLADEHALTNETDIESYMDQYWPYSVNKYTKLELLNAIKETQASYNEFVDFSINDLND